LGLRLPQRRALLGAQRLGEVIEAVAEGEVGVRLGKPRVQPDRLLEVGLGTNAAARLPPVPEV